MTKHAHRVNNLVKEMSILSKYLIKHGAVSVVEQCSYLSNLRVKASILLVKPQSRKVSFLRFVCCISSLVAVECVEELSFIRLTFVAVKF